MLNEPEANGSIVTSQGVSQLRKLGQVLPMVLTAGVNDSGPSLCGSIWLVIPPTRLTRRLEKNLTRPNALSI